MQAQTDFYEIYDYCSQPMLERLSVQIGLGIFILVLICLIVFFILKRSRRPIAVWEWALKELGTLKPEKCLSKNEYKFFYFKLTGILKKYLNKRFNWLIENKTDEELVLYLKKQNFDSNLISLLEKTLQGASWIKFANEDAIKNQAEADLKTVMFVVDQTKPTENK